MAVDPQVVVNIASEFTGKKAFKEAETATTKLSKGVKSLAKTLAVAFSVTAVLRFGRAAARSFAEAEKEAKLLGAQLDAVNLGFAAPFLNSFIDKLALATGIGGGDLTRAFVSLSQATGDATQAQKLLQTALDVSLATGKDLQAVSNGLARAFKGETTALARLRIGFTTAELKGKSFNQILELLNGKYLGAGAKALDTYAVKIARLAEAGDQAKEALARGFVDGLEASGMSVEDFQEKIIELGTQIGTALGKAAGSFEKLDEKLTELSKNPAIKLILKAFDALIGLDPIIGSAADQLDKTNKLRKKQAEAYAKELSNRGILLKIAQAEALAAKKRLNEQKLLTKEKANQLALDKAALALGKGTDVFDLDKIQVQAALLAKQDEINKLGANATDQQKLQLANDLTRLSIKKTMAELEDAIAAKDVEAATRLAKKLNLDLAILGALQGQEFKLKDIEKIINSFMPKKLIDIDNLDQALLLLGKMAGLKITPSTTTTTTTTTTTPTSTTTTTTPSTTITPTTPNTITTIINDAVAAIASSEFAGTSLANPANILSSARLTAQLDQIMAGFTATNNLAADRYTAQLEEITARNTMTNNLAAGRYEAMQNFYVTVNAGVVGSEDTISQAVQKAILDLERKGDPLRYTGGL